MSASTVKPTGRFKVKGESQSRVVCEVTFRVHRSGLYPVIEFVPDAGIGGVSDLTKPERRELFKHVRSMLRDRRADRD